MTFHDLKWPWRHGEGSLVAIFRLRVSSLPVTRCLSVSNGFLPKEAPFIFLPWLIMKRSQNWPDLGSWISTFRDIHFIDTGTDINCSMFEGDGVFGVAMTSIQTFSEVSSLDVTWWPDLERPRSEIFTTYAEKMYQRLYQKRWCSAPLLFRYLRKTWRGGGVQTPPGPAWVSLRGFVAFYQLRQWRGIGTSPPGVSKPGVGALLIIDLGIGDWARQALLIRDLFLLLGEYLT